MNDVIKEHSGSLQKLTAKLLERLIDYLEVNAGGIMLYHKDESGNTENDSLEMVAGFGYNRERLEKKRMYIDEGLPGACFKEKKTMVVDNIPDEYYIGSGLGKARMTGLVLVPLKMLEEIVGIMEISSLKSLEPRKIKLLESVAENIASHIINLESRAKIEKMYEVSQQQTERLHEQEEEMRQQMEELQATQEESRRREEELQKELKQCREELKKQGKKKGKQT